MKSNDIKNVGNVILKSINYKFKGIFIYENYYLIDKKVIWNFKNKMYIY